MSAATRLLALALLAAVPVVASGAGPSTSAPASAASAPGADAPVPVPAAAAIDARRAMLRASERMVDGFSTEGTAVTALRGPRGLEKIEVEALFESGRALFDFYWSVGALVAARERRFLYGDSITGLPLDRALTHQVLDETFAFSAGRATGHWLDGQPVAAGSGETRTRARELADHAASFRRLMQMPQPAGREDCDWACTGDGNAACRRWTCR